MKDDVMFVNKEGSHMEVGNTHHTWELGEFQKTCLEEKHLLKDTVLLRHCVLNFLV